MTTTTLTCVTLACSGCGDDDLHDDFTPHFTDIAAARAQAAEYDWWTDGADVDLCGNCKGEPHPYAPATDAPWSCTRCSNEEADHDGSAPVAPRPRVIPGQLTIDGDES